MLKWLLFLFCLFFFWRFWRGRQVAGRRDPRRRPEAGRVEQMRTCAHCGVYFPENDGVRGSALHFCCEAHRQAGARPSGNDKP